MTNLSEPTSRPAQGRPRGRPQQLPLDSTPSDSARVNGTKRLAWVMATRRVLGDGDPESGGMSRSELAERLRSADVKADPSRISRWESGLEHLPARLVQAYEVATGAAAGTLDVVRRMLVREGHLEERGSGRNEAVVVDPEMLDDIMDRVASQNMRGDLWLAFADELRRYDRVYLRKRMWRNATDLLVEELARSTGPSHLVRYQAAADLMAHPVARIHLSRSVGQYVLDAGAPMVSQVLAVLGEAPDRAATDLVLRMVATSPKGIRHQAALLASSLVGRGHLPADSQPLEVYAGRTVTRSLDGSLVRLGPVDLVCRLADEPFGRVLTTVGNPRERHWLQSVRETRLLVDGDTARTVADQVAHQAEVALGRYAQDPDPMLRRLLVEALFHVHQDRREHAAILLRASPYAAALARALVDVTAAADVLVARLAWAALGRLGSTLAPAEVAPQIAAEARPGVQHLALACAAGLGGELTNGLARHIALVVESPATDDATALAGVVALGMNRRDRLDGVRRESAQPTIQWFHATGGAIRDR